MRGPDTHQTQMFSYLSQEDRIPADHPLRAMREMVDFVLQRMSRRFSAIYSIWGRPSIPPEKLLRALVLQILYSIRSERLLMEQLNYNLLFRWFVGLNPDDPVWVPTVYSKNRDRFLKGGVSVRFFREVVALARNDGLLSDEHFTVDGTLIESVASLKSFRPKGARRMRDPDDPGNPTVNFHGEKRGNKTHESTTDPEARLSRKGRGKEARLYYVGSVLMDNRHGLVTECDLRPATGTAERDAAAELLKAKRKEVGPGRLTLGADKGYDTKGFVAAARGRDVTPHVAQKSRSAIDGRTTRHAGYAVSQIKRKAVEEIFGWLKIVGLLKRSRFVGTARTAVAFTFGSAVYNILRMRSLANAG